MHIHNIFAVPRLDILLLTVVNDFNTGISNAVSVRSVQAGVHTSLRRLIAGTVSHSFLHNNVSVISFVSDLK